MAVQDRAVATRAAIVRAAAEEFNAVGYVSASMQTISVRLGKTKGAISYHFPSKASLAVAIMDDFYDRWPTVVASVQAEGSSGLAELIRLSRRVSTLFANDVMVRAAVRLQRESTVVDAPLPTPYVGWLTMTEAILEAGLVSGEIQPGTDARRTARTIIATFFGLQQMASDLGELHDLEASSVAMWRTFIPALITPTSEAAVLAALEADAVAR